MILLIAQGVIALILSIIGAVIATNPDSPSYMIYMFGIMFGSWITRLVNDIKEWRKKK